VPDKTAKCIMAALNDIAYKMPLPILGEDSDNGSEFIHVHILLWCQRRQITFTRARPANKNDGCHVEQKNWAVVRTVVGYYRYHTAAELLLLNEIRQLQSKLTNYFHPQQKLISKVHDGRQGVQETRHCRHRVPSRDRSPNHDRRANSGADPDLLPDQSRRHTTPDPSPDRSAPHHDHQQSWTRQASPSQRARTVT
jgi:hypothetical protein